LLRRLAWALALALSGGPAFAETVVLDALDWGTSWVPGARGAHAVGGGGLRGEEQAFFVFDASAIDAPIVAATVQLQNPPGTFQSPQGSERFVLYLGSEANTLGSLDVVAGSPAVLELAIAGPYLRVLERSGAPILLNGRLATLDRPSKPRERLFDGTAEGAVPPPRLVLTTDPPAAPAAPLTLHVDAASDVEPQDGSSGAPFRRIQDALSIATPEDVVQVAPGTYTGGVGLREGVALLGSGADETTLDFSRDAGLSGIRCADGARLEGFRIADARTAGAPEDGAIVCSDASTEIAHNTIEVGWRPAIWTDAEAWIHHNTIRGGPDAEHWSQLAAIVAAGDTVIEANEIAAAQSAIVIETGGARLCRNVVRGLVTVRSYDALSSEVTICNNVFLPSVGAPSLGGLIRNEYADVDATLVRVVGNTFHDTPGIRAEAGATTIANNLLVNGTAGIQAEAGSGVEIRHNDAFGNRAGFIGASTNYVGSIGDQTGSNGNVSVDPDFVDTFFEDFRLRPGSPARDAGASGDVTGDEDLDGDARVVDAVDMGAQEHQPGEELPLPPLPIQVDLLPGRSPNELKFTKVVKANGKVAVAILSDDALDAPDEVNVATLILDREPVLRCSDRDVDRDGRRDLACSFPLRGITLGGWPFAVPPACVRGWTHGARKLLGCDEVEVEP
jgi:hypothetical protein